MIGGEARKGAQVDAQRLVTDGRAWRDQNGGRCDEKGGQHLACFYSVSV